MSDNLSKYFSKSKKKKSMLEEYAVPLALGAWLFKSEKAAKKERENEQIIHLLTKISKQQEKEQRGKHSFLVRTFIWFWSLFVSIIKIIFWIFVALFLFYIFTQSK